MVSPQGIAHHTSYSLGGVERAAAPELRGPPRPGQAARGRAALRHGRRRHVLRRRVQRRRGARLSPGPSCGTDRGAKGGREVQAQLHCVKRHRTECKSLPCAQGAFLLNYMRKSLLCALGFPASGEASHGRGVGGDVQQPQGFEAVWPYVPNGYFCMVRPVLRVFSPRHKRLQSIPTARRAYEKPEDCMRTAAGTSGWHVGVCRVRGRSASMSRSWARSSSSAFRSTRTKWCSTTPSRPSHWKADFEKHSQERRLCTAIARLLAVLCSDVFCCLHLKVPESCALYVGTVSSTWMSSSTSWTPRWRCTAPSRS